MGGTVTLLTKRCLAPSTPDSLPDYPDGPAGACWLRALHQRGPLNCWPAALLLLGTCARRLPVVVRVHGAVQLHQLLGRRALVPLEPCGGARCTEAARCHSTCWRTHRGAGVPAALLKLRGSAGSSQRARTYYEVNVCALDVAPGRQPPAAGDDGPVQNLLDAPRALRVQARGIMPGARSTRDSPQAAARPSPALSTPGQPP